MNKRDITRCIKIVWDKWTSHQCRRKRGYGANKKYCKQHATMRGE